MTEKESTAFVERFTVRFPDGLRDAIAERAKLNGRSMNSEIIQVLQDALDAAAGKVNVDDGALADILVKLRRHSQEQDMLINELVQAMESKKSI